MINKTRAYIEKPSKKLITSEVVLAQWKMVNTTKLMLCDFDKKSAKSKIEKQDIEQLITKMEMIIKEFSERTTGVVV
ncbi:hypothetical protein [Moritella sp. Urea-trap-13]|uniref:hypothetical protein n=1 Tax=Moritella sp. Urea-trap-13 TaxID=2058327 RepID=UPI000CB43169|nr:hypothetical protein [Moritella sp. Urea-trap-13]PKH08009.1 hypothetical protein CXF93_04835 [Moritella sp. Urea-trap-13]